MIDSLKSHSLIMQLLSLYDELGSGPNFHKKSHKLLLEMSSENFIFMIFEQNIIDNNFLNKKWNSCEIPQLTIFEDDKITLKYHFFIPAKPAYQNNAAYLIHHHGDNILSSHIFYGPGYQTIEFQKDILQLSDQSYKLKISKDFFHANGATNLLEDYIPHLIFNVSKPTSSIALWSNSKSNTNKKLRLNYTLEKGIYYGCTDSQFIKETKKDSRFEENSEKHVQAICYFMQKLGYKNKIFISDLLQEAKLNTFWRKWLTKLKNDSLIELPYFENSINTLGKDIGIESIRKS
jgi:hypothetical protein|tara:strand:- start:2475 stop:3347 length:873 start_codon:yes stop_codon:yes gene_type:complete